MKRILLTICYLLPILIFAQSKQTILRYELKAEESFRNNEYGEALQYYEKYEELTDRLSVEVSYKMGISYLEIYHYREALIYLERCRNERSLLNFSYDYYYAKSLQLNDFISEAKIYYQRYLNSIQEERNYKKFVPEIKRELERCDNALALMSKPTKVKVSLLGFAINGPFDEHSPLITADGNKMYFTSDRKSTTGGHKFKLDGTFFEDIYVSNKVNGKWEKPKKVRELDSKDHDACVALSHDGRQMIIYRYSHSDFFHRAKGQLYLSKLNNNHWSKPQLLPIPSSAKAREVSACFSINDQEIYFTSDREGGFGGTDIYRTQLTHGVWSEPINLGDSINTPYDEDAPFVHPNGKMFYFSSTGHNSMGGYDIFKSRLTGNHEFSKPQNMGYPINTTGDDISFSVSADGQKIYFADNRSEGKGDMDIYTADFKDENNNLYILKGKVLSEEKNTPLDVVINVYERGKQSVLSVYSSNAITGDFVIMLNEGKKYVVEIIKEGREPYIQEIDVEKITGFKLDQRDLILKAK